MAFIRVKMIKSGNTKRPYSYLVENRWENGKVRQKTLKYLGVGDLRGQNVSSSSSKLGTSKSTFYDKMPSYEFETQFRKRIEEINTIKDPGKKLEAIEQVYDDIGIYVIDPTGNIVSPEWTIPTLMAMEKSVRKRLGTSSEEKKFSISKDDIDKQTARNAYRNTYFDPGGRGETARNDYVIIMSNDYKQLKKLANNPEQKKILEEEMTRYKKGFVEKYNDILHSHSRLASTHITGGSNFPVRRQQKLQGWHENKQKNFEAWRKKVKTSIKRKLKKAITEEEIKVDRNTTLSRNINQIEASYRAVENKKEWDISPQYIRNLEKSKIYDRIARLAKNGDTEEVNRQLDIIKVRQDKFGKSFFTKKHKIWKLDEVAKKRRDRTEALSNLGTRQVTLERFSGEGTTGKIVKNYDEDRIQIRFSDKPSSSVRGKLKASGWRWSNRNNAWQRKLTNNAEYNAKFTIKQFYELET